MSTFDAAVGMDESTLNHGASGLFANPQARQQFFKGSQSGSLGKLQYTVTFDIQAAPTFVLSPPPLDRWTKSINDKGKNPAAGDLPAGNNVFQLHFPQFLGQYTMAGASKSGTAEVYVTCTFTIDGSKLTLKPLAIWLDESKMKDWDKAILNIILMQVLQQAEKMLAGLDIPPLSFSESGVQISMTPPAATIADGHLVVAASLSSKGSVDLTGATWPAEQPLFILLSSDLLTKVATEGAQSQLVGQEFTGNGSYEKVLSYDWKAKVNSVSGITPTASDMTKVSANVGFGFEATLKPLGIGGPCAISAATGNI